ncbi:MAG: hypothetical protein GXY11_04935 [Clostridiales bacterium]|nr:hypothetical protein [Clostridiales bacterium]
MKGWKIAVIVVACVAAVFGVLTLFWMNAQSEGKRLYEESEEYKEVQRLIDESNESIDRSNEIIDRLK